MTAAGPTTLQLGLLVFLVVCAVGTALLRDVLAAIIVFAAYSFGMAILYVVLQAPDVGLTEAAVGAGVMTILLLLTIAKTVRPSDDRIVESVEWRAVVVVGAFAAVLGLTLPALPPVGSPESAVVTDQVTEFYLANAEADTGVKNAVTAVLAAYRGFDTLGEAVVVFTAAIATLVVFRREVFV
jgi:multicomponent Na+:H+ antiporter subunit B